MTYRVGEHEMILFDTETTGLSTIDNRPLDEHPEIIEFAAIRVDFNSLQKIDKLEFLCKTKFPSDQGALKMHGITAKMVRDEKPFKAHYAELMRFFFGVKYMLAHNVSFDRYMMHTELKRMDKVTNFPWPPMHLCTVEKTMHLQDGKRSSLDFLVKYYLGIDKRKGSHRAMADVEDLYEVVKCMRKEGLL